MSSQHDVEIHSHRSHRPADKSAPYYEIPIKNEQIEGAPGYKSYVQRAPFFQYLFFLFELPTIFKARELQQEGKALDQNHLPSLGDNERAENIEAGIQRHMQSQREKNPNKKPNLAWAVLYVGRMKLFYSMLFEVLLMFLRIFSCYCCKRLIEALSGPDVPNPLAFKWAGTLCGVLLGALFLEHHFYFIKTRLPLHLKGALVSLIYSKIGRLSTYSLNKISLGKIVNIVANDLNMFERTGIFFPNIVTGIIGLIAGTALLWIFFGPVCLIGIGYILISFPIQRLISGLSIKPRIRQNKITDERVRVTGEVIEGIRLLKMYTWELVFRDNVAAARKKEIKELSTVHEFESVSRAIALSSQVIASFLIFMPYNLMGNELEISTIFPAFFMIGFLRMNAVFFFSVGLTFATEAKLLFDRIVEILEEPEMAESNIERPHDRDNAIEFENFTAFWTREAPKEHLHTENVKTENEQIHTTQESRAVLYDINLKIKKGSLNALVGKVGSGKSSFALAFTGEMPRTTGHLRMKGNVAYVEQEPTIFAGTIRDNILFGKEFKQEFYDKVIEGCNLISDLKLFATGDQSEVGEKGVNLSGGQKARIALARAVYADADIYLLDDPLSAVDAKVAKSLFNNAISTLLKDKTVILITHQVHFVKNLENIIVIDEGRVMGYGSFDSIRRDYVEIDKVFNAEKLKSLQEIKNVEEDNYKQNAAITQAPTEDAQKKEGEEEKKDDDQPDEGAGKLVSAEDANAGQVTSQTYMSYLREMGGICAVLLMLIVFVSNELAGIAYGIILSDWADGAIAKKASIGIMGGITGFVVFIHIVKNVMFSHMLLRASHRYHDKMLDRIVRNPVQFFDTNPLGRILNRFSNDLGVLDRFLPMTLHDVCDHFFLIGVVIIVLAVIQPWLLLPLGLGIIGIVFLLRLCYESIKQSRKYELVSKSPLYSLFSASLSGMIIIRNYKQFDNFKEKFGGFLHDNTKGAVAFWSISRFFGFSVDFIYLLTGIGNVFILTALSDNVGFTAFGLVLLLSITSVLQYALRQLVQTHVLMASVERLRSYCNTQTEAELVLPDDEKYKKEGWPQKGEISLNKVYMKYRENTDYVIRDLTVNAQPGEKIGCIGRTGAGKSSIIQTLFRMVEIDKKGEDTAQSEVQIDGVNTRNVGLHLLRNSISIIPQTPFIFSGTVKKNLDPLGVCSDEQLWSVLEDVGLKRQVEELDQKLYTDMTNASSVFSVGQKQLICLARTILKKSKVLVLDEATANVDKQTDDFIQATIMKKFSDCTIFTIAHRLSTIANYDKVLVLDKGRKVEFDAPYKLLVKNIGDESITNTQGHFASMVLNTGPKTSQQILRVAKEKYYSSQE